ncbi:MAG TPA: endonuclease/exonuclease/phosphatase family protein [Tepidisphaeraceae bacterium]|nr:endonuclease/exonuclease/phosphatase family protein [Tepidisphaeraceae bacterium]
MRTIVLLVLTICLTPLLASAEQIRIATYNIENFRKNFLGHKASQNPALANAGAEVTEMIETLRRINNKDNWMLAQLIAHPDFSPDILVIQEGCTEADLRFFNRRWLNNRYETVKVFPSNTTRDQHLGLMIRPGFKIIETRDQYHKEPDPTPNPRGERLFARGPAFVLIESPGGYRFWVGTNHMKSRSGNSLDVTRWRNREARRSNEILHELAGGAVKDFVFLGDFNDEIGFQEFEQEAGGDAMAILVGDFHLATRALAESGKITFGGYWFEDRRSFIDHVIVHPSMKDRIADVKVIDMDPARFASDHYPVMITITSPK